MNRTYSIHQQENRVKSIEQEARFKQESMDQSSQRIEVNAEELKKNEEEVKEDHRDHTIQR